MSTADDDDGGRWVVGWVKGGETEIETRVTFDAQRAGRVRGNNGARSIIVLDF